VSMPTWSIPTYVRAYLQKNRYCDFNGDAEVAH
ncbi:transposase, partial [Escherichia coli]|nr:transposase [Escherichia coli]EFY2182618.1 transposase [Shigella flexneri]